MWYCRMPLVCFRTTNVSDQRAGNNIMARSIVKTGFPKHENYVQVIYLWWMIENINTDGCLIEI